MKKFQLSASIICANLLTLDKEVDLIKKGKIDRIHFDVMDGIFVPRYGLPPETLKFIHDKTNIPVTVHMMVDNPEPYIDIFSKAGADTIVFHVEPVNHIHRIIQKIKANGIKAGLALNPATPLSVLDYILQDIDLVMLMAINPGIVGHKLIPWIYKKISDLKDKLTEFPQVMIEIDGGVTFESAPKMVKSGADILVCGSSTIFRLNESISSKLNELSKVINNEI